MIRAGSASLAALSSNGSNSRVRWKTAATLTGSDEKLLDELHDAARRLDDRLNTIERIMTVENPNWRSQSLPEPGRQRLLTDEDM